MSECGIHFAQEYVLVKQEQRSRINYCASVLREILLQETSTTLQTHEGRSHWKLEQVPNLDRLFSLTLAQPLSLQLTFYHSYYPFLMLPFCESVFPIYISPLGVSLKGLSFILIHGYVTSAMSSFWKTKALWTCCTMKMFDAWVDFDIYFHGCQTIACMCQLLCTPCFCICICVISN